MLETCRDTITHIRGERVTTPSPCDTPEPTKAVIGPTNLHQVTS